MKIAICAEHGKRDARMDKCVSLSPYFVLANTESDALEYLENPASEGVRRRGERAAEVVIDSGASAVIGTDFGDRAFHLLNQWGIAVHRAKPAPVLNLIEDFKAGRIPRAESGNPCDQRDEARICGKGHGHRHS